MVGDQTHLAVLSGEYGRLIAVSTPKTTNYRDTVVVLAR